MDEPKSSTVFDPLNTSFHSIELGHVSKRVSAPDQRLSREMNLMASHKYSQVEWMKMKFLNFKKIKDRFS